MWSWWRSPAARGLITHVGDLSSVPSDDLPRKQRLDVRRSVRGLLCVSRIQFQLAWVAVITQSGIKRRLDQAVRGWCEILRQRGLVVPMAVLITFLRKGVAMAVSMVVVVGVYSLHLASLASRTVVTQPLSVRSSGGRSVILNIVNAAPTPAG